MFAAVHFHQTDVFCFLLVQQRNCSESINGTLEKDFTCTTNMHLEKDGLYVKLIEQYLYIVFITKYLIIKIY